MSGPVRPLRVGVVGLFGTGNFGNEATLTAVLARLADEHQVLVIAQGAVRVRADRGVPGVSLGEPITSSPRAWARAAAKAGNRLGVLLRALRVVRDVDALVVGGCGVWERLGAGPFGLAYELWSLALAARLRRRPFVLWDVGVEAQDHVLTRWFIRRSAAWATYRSFRDVRSLHAMRQMRAAAGSDPVVADLAFGLRIDQAASRTHEADAEAPVIVGVMTYYGEADDPTANVREHDSYLRRTIDLVRELRERGHTVVLVGGDEYDLPTARAVHDAVSDGAVRVDSAGTVSGLVDLMRGACAVVAVRYHTLIMGALAGAPVVAIAYGEKHQSLLTMLGSPERVRHADSFDPADVADLVTAAINDGPGRERAAAAMAEAAGRLNREWAVVRAALHRHPVLRAPAVDLRAPS